MDMLIKHVKKMSFILFPGLILTSGIAFSAENAPSAERQEELIHIDGAIVREVERIREVPEITPPPEIPPEDLDIPTVPKEIVRTDLGPAEKVRLDVLEHAFAAGKTTQTEYELERDTLFREANIVF